MSIGTKRNREQVPDHGISLAEIEQVFAELAQVAPDLKHSDSEPRQLSIGRTAAGRYAFVVFTMRGDPCTALKRPTSCIKKEIDRYDPQGP